MSLPSNFSVLSIPAYYVLSLLPHSYAISVASRGQPLKWDNRNPRATDLKEKLKAKLSADDYALYERGEAASSNSYENQAFFFAAIILGHVAGVDKDYLNSFAFKFLLIRTAYALCYVGISNQKFTPIRTGLYLWGVGQCIQAFLEAAKKMK